MGWFNDKLGFDIPFITGSGSVTDALFGESGSPGLFSNPSGAWDEFKNGKTNTINQGIAEQNLAYQKERARIEDERYAEETAYNRAWAEDERDYNRALQQQLFEREDTALERQASSLSAMGINPLSQQLNGLGAGAQVSSASAPSASGRMSETPQNNFRMQDIGVLQALAPLASLANTINQVATGQGQRDLIRAQVDKQQLDNFIVARQYGLQPEFMKGYSNYKQSDNSGNMWFNMNGINQFNKNRLDNQSWFINDLHKQDFQRELNYRKTSGMYNSAPNWANTFNWFASDSFADVAERALTQGSKLFDKAFNNGIDDNSKNSKKFNPFSTFLSLFF